jgi:Metallo-peptidase family M12
MVLMVSIKNLAVCIGLSGSISIVRHFFGYGFRGHQGQISLLGQAKLLKGKHIHVNIIRVGIESFNDTDEREIDRSIQITRNLYAEVNLGVGRIERYFITNNQANGHQNIDDDAEAALLTREWTVPNEALDAFYVLTYAGTTVGRSAINGPCDKDVGDMNGSVIAIETIPDDTGFTLAHELGHYLGLSHVCELAAGGGCGSGTCQPVHNNSLMHPCVPNGGNISSSEENTMKGHCFVKGAC